MQIIKHTMIKKKLCAKTGKNVLHVIGKTPLYFSTLLTTVYHDSKLTPFIIIHIHILSYLIKCYILNTGTQWQSVVLAATIKQAKRYCNANWYKPCFRAETSIQICLVLHEFWIITLNSHYYSTDQHHTREKGDPILCTN